MAKNWHFSLRSKLETSSYFNYLSQLQFRLTNNMRFVNNFELSLILAQPQIYSSNRLGAMASQRDEGHFEMAKKTL